jgi:hypothetical protein
MQTLSFNGAKLDSIMQRKYCMDAMVGYKLLDVQAAAPLLVAGEDALEQLESINSPEDTLQVREHLCI